MLAHRYQPPSRVPRWCRRTRVLFLLVVCLAALMLVTLWNANELPDDGSKLQTSFSNLPLPTKRVAKVELDSLGEAHEPAARDDGAGTATQQPAAPRTSAQPAQQQEPSGAHGDGDRDETALAGRDDAQWAGDGGGEDDDDGAVAASPGGDGGDGDGDGDASAAAGAAGGAAEEGDGNEAGDDDSFAGLGDGDDFDAHAASAGDDEAYSEEDADDDNHNPPDEGNNNDAGDGDDDEQGSAANGAAGDRAGTSVPVSQGGQYSGREGAGGGEDLSNAGRHGANPARYNSIRDGSTVSGGPMNLINVDNMHRFWWLREQGYLRKTHLDYHMKDYPALKKESDEDSAGGWFQADVGPCSSWNVAFPNYCLGMGTYGSVYAATCDDPETTYAVKFGRWWRRGDGDDIGLTQEDQSIPRKLVPWDSNHFLWEEYKLLKKIMDFEFPFGRGNVMQVYGFFWTETNEFRDRFLLREDECIDMPTLDMLDERHVQVASLVIEMMDQPSLWSWLNKRSVMTYEDRYANGTDFTVTLHSRGDPRYLRRIRPAITPQFGSVILGLAQGYRRLHAMNIFHRDTYNPGKNAFVKRSKDKQYYSAALVDLGMSVQCAPGDEGIPSARALDMYAFGNTLYFACTGHQPYKSVDSVYFHSYSCTDEAKNMGIMSVWRNRHLHDNAHPPPDETQDKWRCLHRDVLWKLIEDLFRPVHELGPPMEWHDVIDVLESLYQTDPTFYLGGYDYQPYQYVTPPDDGL